MTSYPLPATLFNSLGYFYANSSNVLGAFAKEANQQTFVSVDYSGVIAGSSITEVPSFSVDIGSAPPLLISSASVSGDNVSFIVSDGVMGVTYDITMTATFNNGVVRSDTLEVSVPSSNYSLMQSIANVINVGNAITGFGLVYINSGVRYFVNGTPPQAPNLLDVWYNPITKTLYMYITDGVSQSWWAPLGKTLLSGATPLYMEALTVTGINTVSALTYTPDGQTIILIVNNQSFMPIGPNPAFTLSGQNIIWESPYYTINLGDEVEVVYTMTVPNSAVSLVSSENFYMEPLTVTNHNTVSALTYQPNGDTLMLIVNGRTFIPRGASPPFTNSGKNIVWLSTKYSINFGDDVKAVYTYFGQGT